MTTREVVRREIMRFAIPGLAGLVLLALASLAVSSAVARQQSLQEAHTTAQWLARTVVSPRIDQGLREGKPARIAELDAVFSASVRGSGVRAVRLWNDEGVIVYSDDPRLMGERFPLPVEAAGGPVVEAADQTRPENRYLDPGSSMVQVSMPVVGEDGSRYLLQISKLQDRLREDARGVWVAFAPVVAGSMALLAALMVLLGVRMARRISADLRTRQELLQRAADASDAERRRIAADLHDGTVQDLAGLSYALAGMAERAQGHGDPSTASLLREASGRSRACVSELRSLIVDIYPPDLEERGLPDALTELLGGLDPAVEVCADMAEPTALDHEGRRALYRIAREALTNTTKHSEASRVGVRLAREGTGVVLIIEDDGCGFDVDSVPDGHLGLRLMHDLAASVGGRLTVDSAPGAGTTVRVAVEGR